jgi:hypothetical protein
MPIPNSVRLTATFDEAPCELCSHAAVCKTGNACPAFDAFVQFGGRRWRALARVPDGVATPVAAANKPKHDKPREVAAVDGRSVEVKAFMLS